MNYRIAFAIITWNSEKYIKKCLDSIESFKKLDYEIFVVDNGSIDNTVKILKENNNNKIHVDCLEKNLGTTISRNIALKKIDDSFDYVSVLDSDTIVNENAFINLIDKLKKDESIGIIGPQLVCSDGRIQNSGRNLPTPKEKILKILPFKKIQELAINLEKVSMQNDTYEVGYLMSACWLMPRSIIEKIGFLDGKIFYAPEDAEYCMRAWQYGYKVVFSKDVYIIHEWQRISRKKIISKINYEHIKGLIYFWKKYKMKDITEINKKVCKR